MLWASIFSFCVPYEISEHEIIEVIIITIATGRYFLDLGISDTSFIAKSFKKISSIAIFWTHPAACYRNVILYVEYVVWVRCASVFTLDVCDGDAQQGSCAGWKKGYHVFYGQLRGYGTVDTEDGYVGYIEVRPDNEAEVNKLPQFIDAMTAARGIAPGDVLADKGYACKANRWSILCDAGFRWV